MYIDFIKIYNWLLNVILQNNINLDNVLSNASIYFYYFIKKVKKRWLPEAHSSTHELVEIYRIESLFTNQYPYPKVSNIYVFLVSHLHIFCSTISIW